MMEASIRRRRALCILGVLGLLLSSPWVYAQWRQFGWSRQIEAFEGDGAIRDSSIDLGVGFIPGYQVDFPEFSLDEPFSATYTFSNLPRHESSGIYLGIRDAPDDGLEFRAPDEPGGAVSVNGTIRIRLYNGRDETLVELKESLRNLTWWESTEENLAYDSDGRTRFDPGKRGELTLEVSFEPIGAAGGFEGFVRVSEEASK